MTKTKQASAALALFAALSAGLYLSGWLALFFLKLDTGVLAWSTYLGYWQAIDLPAYSTYSQQIHLAGYIGIGTPMLLWLGLLVLLAPSIHGDARFATGADLGKFGMFKPAGNGILVGKFDGKLVRLPGQQFVILAAPTRSGKGVGIVIPNLLEYGESMVVLDIKQENYELTSGWRASQGQEVYLFNPFAEDRRSHR